MLLPQEIFLWLQAEGGIQGADGRTAGNGAVELSANAVDSVLSGQAVARVLSGHMQRVQGVDSRNKEVQLLDRIGYSHAGGVGPSERLYAWNMLTPLLSRLNLTLTADEKTLMVAGDDEVALHVLKDVKRKIGGGGSRSSQGKRENRTPSRNGIRGSQDPASGYKTPRSQVEMGRQSYSRDRGVSTPFTRCTSQSRNSCINHLRVVLKSVRLDRSNSSQGNYKDQSYPNPFNSDGGNAHRGQRYSDQTPRSRSQTPLNGQPRGGDYTVLPGINSGRSQGRQTPYQGFRQSSRGGRDPGSGAQMHGNGSFSPAVHRGNEVRNSQLSGFFAGQNGIQPANGIVGNYEGRSGYNPARPKMEGPLSARSGAGALGPLASLLAKYTGLSGSQALQALNEPGQGLVKEFLEGEASRGGKRPGSPMNFLQDVMSISSDIVRGLLQEDSTMSDRNSGVVLQGVHWGLLSRSVETATTACKILARIGDGLVQDDRFRASKIWMWFSDPEPDGGPIAVICTGLQRHDSLAPEVAKVLRSLGRDKIGDLFTRELPTRFGRTSSFLRVVRLLVLAAKGESELRDEIVRQGALHKLLQVSMSESHYNKGDSSRISAFWLISAMWQTFPAEVAATPAAPETFNAIKGGLICTNGVDVAEKATEVEAAAHEAVFELLSTFIGQKSPNASTTYKLIVSALLENYPKEKLRDFTQRKLGGTLQANPRMPLGLLVEPLMKKVRACGYNGFDIEFHLMLAKHPRLEPAQALMILDVEARICFSDPNQTQLAGVCLIELLRRYEDLPSVSDFVDRLARLGFGIVQSGRHEDVHDKEMGGKQVLQRKLAILDIIHRIADLRHGNFNGHISNHLQTALSSLQGQSGKVAYKATMLAEVLGLARSGEAARFKLEQARSDVSALSPRPNVSPQKIVSEDSRAPDQQQQVSARNRYSEASDPARQSYSRDQSDNRSRRSANESHARAKKDDSLVDQEESFVERVRSWKREEPMEKRMPPARYSDDDRVLLSDEDQPVQEEKVSAADRRAANAERAKKQEEERKAAILAKREARNKNDRSKDSVPEEEDKPKGPTAAERRAANLDRAKRMEEEKKAAIMAKRAARGKPEDLPNLMTEEQLKKQVPKKVMQSRQPDRPSSVLRQRRSSSRASRASGSDDDRMSLPDREAPRSHRSHVPQRPPSAKTRKREAEISEIRRRRDQRLREQQSQQEKARDREKQLFDQARKEVERRMAVLRQQKDEDMDLSREPSGLDDSFNSVSRKPSAHHSNRVDLNNPKHQGFASKFDLERHHFMWLAQPRRRETVRDIVGLLEEIFTEVTAEPEDKQEEDAETRARRKGARLRRGDDDVQRVQQERGGSMTPAGRLDREDRELLHRSSLQNDEQLKKMLKRQEYLRRKLSQQREEKRAAEEERQKEEERLKKAMAEEKRREKEAEEARRKKIKEKLAKYKSAMEQQRQAQEHEAIEKERMSAADRKKKLQEYLKKKQAEEQARADAASKLPKEDSVESPTNKKGTKKTGGPGAGKKNPKLEVVDLLNSDYVPSPTYLETTGKTNIGGKSPMSSPRGRKGMSLKAKPGKVAVQKGAKVSGADKLDGKGVTKPAKGKEHAGSKDKQKDAGASEATEGAGPEVKTEAGDAAQKPEAEATEQAVAEEGGDPPAEEAVAESKEEAPADAEAAESKGEPEATDEKAPEDKSGEKQDLLSPEGDEEKWEVDDSVEGQGGEAAPEEEVVEEAEEVAE